MRHLKSMDRNKTISVASKPPYGYRLKEVYEGDIKNIKLIPRDDETTEVVKEIFNFYLKGWGMTKIANNLNNRWIPSPSSISNKSSKEHKLWTSNTIRYMLMNPKYCEIISKEVFENVQELIKRRKKSFRHKYGNEHLFSTVLKCNECGGNMCYRERYKGYKCTNSQKGGGRCTAHSVKEDLIKNAILEDLKAYVEDKINKDKFYKMANDRVKCKDNCEMQLTIIDKELKKLDEQFERVYMDKLHKLISDRNYENISRRIQSKQAFLTSKREKVCKMKRNSKFIEKLYEKYRYEVDRILSFKELDRFIVETLIEKIVVNENEFTKNKEIQIYYKFSKV